MRGTKERTLSGTFFRICEAFEFELLILIIVSLIWFTISSLVGHRSEALPAQPCCPLALPCPTPHTHATHVSATSPGN
jgi:hypothetical protein